MGIVLGNILSLPPIPQCGSNVLYWEIYCVSLPFHNVDPIYCVGKYIVSPLPFCNVDPMYCVGKYIVSPLPFRNVDPMYCIGKNIVSPSHSTMWIQCIV